MKFIQIYTIITAASIIFSSFPFAESSGKFLAPVNSDSTALYNLLTSPAYERLKDFYDPEHGFTLDLYTSLIEHFRNQPLVMTRYRQRLAEALQNRGDAVHEIILEMAHKSVEEGFPFEPNRLDTDLSRQAGTAYQAVVELINNGFDAMGVAIGRHAKGGFQAIGLLKKKGQTLTYHSTTESDPYRRFTIVLTKTNGNVRVRFNSEHLDTAAASGTEVIFHDPDGISPDEWSRHEEHIQKRLRRSRRGLIFRGEQGTEIINDLSLFTGLDDNHIEYRLGERGVRYWLSDDRHSIHVKDSGRGVAPITQDKSGEDVSVIFEALLVPYIGVNLTSRQLHDAYHKGDWQADGDLIYMTPDRDSQESAITLAVGGTPVTSLSISGHRLPREMLIDLPTASYQSISREEIIMDDVAIEGFTHIIDRTIRQFRTNPRHTAGIINLLFKVIAQLQKSSRLETYTKKHDLLGYLKTSFINAADELPSDDYVILPNISDDEEFSESTTEGKKQVFIETDLYPFDPSSIHAEMKASKKKTVWIADIRSIFLRIGKMLLLKRDAYQYYQDVSRTIKNKGSILLNKLFNIWIGYGEKPEKEAELLADAPKHESPVSTSDSVLPPEINEIWDTVPSHKKTPLLYEYIRRSFSMGTRKEVIIRKVRNLLKIKGLAKKLSITDDLFMFPCISAERETSVQKYHRSGDDLIIETWSRKKPGNSMYAYHEEGTHMESITLLQNKLNLIEEKQIGDTLYVCSSKYGEQEPYAKTFQVQYNGRICEDVSELESSRNNFLPIELSGNTLSWTVDAANKRTIFRLNEAKGIFEISLELPEYDSVRIINQSGNHIFVQARKKNTYDLYRTPANEQQWEKIPEFIGLTQEPKILKGKDCFYISYVQDKTAHLYRHNNNGSIEEIFSTPAQEMHIRTYQNRVFLTINDLNDQHHLYRSDENGNNLTETELSKGACEDIQFRKPINGFQYLIAYNENGGSLFRVALSGEVCEPVKPLQDKKAFNNMEQDGKHLFLPVKDDKGWSLFFSHDNGNTWEIAGMIQNRQEQIPLRITEEHTFVLLEEEGLYYIYELSSDKRSTKKLPGITSESPSAINLFSAGKDIYILKDYLSRPKNDSFTISFYRIDLAHNRVELCPGPAYEKILLIPEEELPALVASHEDTVFVQPYDPFLHIVDDDIYIEQIFEDNNFTDLQEHEKRLLLNNLLFFTWSSDEAVSCGWLLPFVPGLYIKNMAPHIRSLLAQHGNNLSDQGKYQTGRFLRHAGFIIENKNTYNRMVERWLSIWHVKPERAVALADMLDQGIKLKNGRTISWSALSEHIDQENIPDTMVLLKYLRGELRLEPLEQGTAMIPYGEKTGECKSKVPLSSLAALRSESSLIDRKKQDLRITDIDQILSSKPDYPMMEDKLQRMLPVSGYRWIYENVQNADKAISRLPGADGTIKVTTVPLEIPDHHNPKTQLIVTTRDHGIGMDEYDIIHDLLPIDRSSFMEGDDPSQGFNGRGWYKNLVGSDEVRVISGKHGTGRLIVLTAIKIKNPDGSFIWKETGFEEFSGEFQGTAVQWIKNFSGTFEETREQIELEAAFIGDQLQHFTGVLSSLRDNTDNKRRILFNGKEIREKINILATVKWKDGEHIHILQRTGGAPSVLHGGYQVMDIHSDPELREMLHPSLQPILDEYRLSLALPSSNRSHPQTIAANSERNGLAEKQHYIERLQKAVMYAVMLASAKELLYKNRPVDIVSRPDRFMRHYARASALADKCNEGRWEDITREEILQLTEDELVSMLMHLKVQTKDPDYRVSLVDVRILAQRISRNELEQNDINKLMAILPNAFARLLRETIFDTILKKRVVSRGKDDFMKVKPEEEWTIEQVYLARLIEQFMTPYIRALYRNNEYSFKIRYGTTRAPRLATMNRYSIIFNENASQVHDWLSWIKEFIEGTGKPDDDYDMLMDIVYYTIHEYAHTQEGFRDETHTEKFRRLMEDIILSMINNLIVPEAELLLLKENAAAIQAHHQSL